MGMDGYWWDWTEARWIASEPAVALPAQRPAAEAEQSEDDLHRAAEAVAFQPSFR